MSIFKKFSIRYFVIVGVDPQSLCEAEVPRLKTLHFQSWNAHYSTCSEILQKMSGKVCFHSTWNKVHLYISCAQPYKNTSYWSHAYRWRSWTATSLSFTWSWNGHFGTIMESLKMKIIWTETHLHGLLSRGFERAIGHRLNNLLPQRVKSEPCWQLPTPTTNELFWAHKDFIAARSQFCCALF